MAETKVLVLVGSLRAGSLNRQLAEVAVESAPASVTVRVADWLGDLPFYNEDVDTPETVPASVVELRKVAAEADAVLAVTPEYNGTIPAALKNVIDWLSRPYGSGAVVGKPLAVIGTSFGQYGGVWAHDETRKSFGIAGADVVDVKLSLPAPKFDGKHPRETAEVVEGVRDVVAKLVAEVG
jgi:NAD(P)H-dependent FMN reductase